MATRIPSIVDVIRAGQEAYGIEFKDSPNVTAYAPGRVNLIGEHVDYNDGFVLPMALPLVTVVIGKQIEGQKSTIMTLNEDSDPPRKVSIEMPSKVQMFPNSMQPSTPRWANYIKGVIMNFPSGKTSLPAFQCVVISSVPMGGGLSSSAALEVAMFSFLEGIMGTTSPLVDKALCCQKAEHDFAGVPCGIMDQLVSIMGQKDNALLIDCRSMATSLIPFKDQNYTILITNSNVKHVLSGSEYPSRRQNCAEASKLLNKSLRDCELNDIGALATLTRDENVIKRARHVITEIARTQQAAQLLRDQQFQEFGELMVESHNSLRDDFEVSTPELDRLVSYAMEVEGALGSRMTGGGFGGCTVTLVKSDKADLVIENINQKYEKQATFYIVKVGQD